MKAINKRGISLIVLVITIIVMIILAGAVMLAISNSGIIDKANKATLQTDLRNFQEQLETYKSEKLVSNSLFDEITLNAHSTLLAYNTKSEEEAGNIYTILPEAGKYGEKIYIENGKIVFKAKGDEIEWCSEIGVGVEGIYISKEGVLQSVMGVENLVDNAGTLVLPSTVKEIARGAFYNTNLKSLKIPGSVKKISAYAFSGNIYLESIEMENGVKTIEMAAFLGCTNLKKVVIPDTVVTLGNSIFAGCTNLNDVTLSKNITSITANMFGTCRNLTTLTIPEKVTNIASEAFYGCSKLSNLNIPKNVTSIVSGAFGGCNLLNLTVDSKNQTYKVMNDLLCTKDGKKVIQVLKAASVETLEIPEGVEEIEFSNMHNLTKLVVPASVKNLGTMKNCHKLSEVEVAEDNQYYSSDEGAIYNKNKTVLIKCIYKGESYTVNESVEIIAQRAMNGISTLKEIILSENLKELSTLAISQCSNLQKIYIGKNLNIISGSSLFNVPALTTVTINSSNTNIKSENGMILSYDGKVLVKVLGNVENEVIEVPGTITKVTDLAFNCQSKVKKIVFKEGLLEIGGSAFNGCLALTRVELPSSITTISQSAFSASSTGQVSVLKEIVINKSPNSISGAPWGSLYGNKAVIWVG